MIAPGLSIFGDATRLQLTKWGQHQMRLRKVVLNRQVHGQFFVMNHQNILNQTPLLHPKARALLNQSPVAHSQS